MKNFIFFIAATVMFISLYSCQTIDEHIGWNDDVEFKSANQANQRSVSSDSKGLSLEGAGYRTHCDITGPSTTTAGSSQSFTYTSNIIDPNITWEVESGDISLIEIDGATATFSFGANFRMGSIKATGNGNQICSETKNIFLPLGPVSGPCSPTGGKIISHITSQQVCESQWGYEWWNGACYVCY